MEATPTSSAPLVGGHFTKQTILGAFTATNPSKNNTQKSYAEAPIPSRERPPQSPKIDRHARGKGWGSLTDAIAHRGAGGGRSEGGGGWRDR